MTTEHESPAARRDGATLTHGLARFTVISPVCIRMEYHPEGRFVDAPTLFAFDRSAGCETFSASTEGRRDQHLTLDTGRMRLNFKADGMPFFGGNLSCTFQHGGGERLWTPEMRNSWNLGGTLDSLDGRRGPVNLGEGLLSRDGWYCIDESRSHVLKDGWVETRSVDAGLDWYLFAYGTDYRSALSALTAVGGSIPLPRRYLLGCWYSRWHAYSSAEYRALLEEYESHGYPLDVLVWDMDWHRQDASSGLGWAWTKGWTGFSWNRELLPDAEALLAELRERGVASVLNVHPHDGIRRHEDMYEPFMRDLGLDPAAAEEPLFDAGDRRYMEAYFRHAHEPLEEAGVAFWWVDWQQDVLIPHVRSTPGLRHLPWLNELYFRHTSRAGCRGVNFNRWAGWGDHRHPIHFSGDAVSGWEMLAFQPAYTATAGNVGCFFWSHDMGGFSGCEDAEIYARWLQFGAFSAAMRLHGLGRDRRPWTWDAWAQPAMRLAFEQRSRLLPYTYSCVARACRDSVPLIRAMYMDEPERDAAYRNPQQYGYGEAMLVAPIASPGLGPGRVAKQVVSFPEGVWFNWFTGERFEGPCEMLVTADMEEMPVYVRAGVPIPMQPYRLRPATAPLTDLIVRCFPGETGRSQEFVLYEDDGETRAYETGAKAETPLRYERAAESGVTVTLGPTVGAWEGMPERRRYRVELPSTVSPREARVNGEPAAFEFDEEGRLTVVEVGEVPVREAVTVTLVVDEADAGVASAEAWSRRRRGAGEALDAELALALRGVGLVHKHESLYRDGADPVAKFYARPGVLEGDRVELAVLAEGRVVAETRHEGAEAFPVAVPIPESASDRPLRLRVRARVDGEAVELETSGSRL